MQLGMKVALVSIYVGRTSAANRDLEGRHQRTEGAGDGVLVQENGNW